VQFFITSNEPQSIKNLFKQEALIIPMDFDMLLCCKTCQLPIERKAVPGDLLSSVTDGRLMREIIAMREESDFYIVLLHGEINYKSSGLVDLGYRGQHKTKGWTKKGVRNLLRSLQYVEGAYLEYAKDDDELVEIIHELQEYFDTNEHNSLRVRSKIHAGMKSRKARVISFYQGLPECRYGRSEMLYKAFPVPLQLYEASIEQINEVRGFGRVLSENIYNFLRTG